VCVVSALLGVVSAPSAWALVPGAPDTPTVTAGNAQITVSFTPPADDGGSPITSYTATCSDGITPTPTSGPASPLTVTGLTNGTSYTCTVTATNSDGDSPPSPASAPATPAAAPDAPSNVTVAATLTSTTVSFTPGAANGSPITSYRAQCISTNGGTSGFSIGAASPITVSALTTGRTYTCTVTATNAIGTSPPSAPSSPVTLSGAPGAPTALTVVPSVTSVRVGFMPGAANGSPITSYRAQCISTNGGTSGFAIATASPITVSALTTGRAYSCTVSATNAEGTSAPSAPVRVTVGAPAAPAILRMISLPNGLAIAVIPGADNGSSIISYRARCTSSNGGFPGYPLRVASPIIVSELTPGATYTCAVSANNLRGEGPARVSGAVVVGAAFSPTVCSGAAGTVTMSPGIAMTSGKPQTIALDALVTTCSGGYVTAGRVRTSFRSSTAMTCRNATAMTSGGSGRMNWRAPRGMGSSDVTMRFVFVSSSGHSTKVHFYGTVTSKANLFTARHISGNLWVNRGLNSIDSGGDCRNVQRMTNFTVTSIKFSIR